MSYQDINKSQSDSMLTVAFYRQLWQNHTKSIEEGRPIFEERDFIKIAVPGNNTLLIDTLAEEHYIQRFPDHYKRYKEAMSNEAVVNGTPLAHWPLVTRTAAEKLRFLKFETVEQIAGADDYQLNAIGMSVGMSPFEFKKLAQAYLESSKSTADVAKRNAELELLRADNDDLRMQNIKNEERLREMERSLAILAGNQANAQSMAPASVSAKPRRARKELVAGDSDPLGDSDPQME